MEIAQALKEWRKNAGYTQKDIANQLNTKANIYGKYERGEQIPGADKIKLIAETFHVSADVLLGIDKSGWEDGETG